MGPGLLQQGEIQKKLRQRLRPYHWLGLLAHIPRSPHRFHPGRQVFLQAGRLWGWPAQKAILPPNSPKQLQLACPGSIWTWMWAGALKNEFLAPPPFPVGALSTAPVGLATRNCFSGLGYNRKNLRRREVALPRARPFLRARLFL